MPRKRRSLVKESLQSQRRRRVSSAEEDDVLVAHDAQVVKGSRFQCSTQSGSGSWTLTQFGSGSNSNPGFFFEILKKSESSRLWFSISQGSTLKKEKKIKIKKKNWIYFMIYNFFLLYKPWIRTGSGSGSTSLQYCMSKYELNMK